MCGICGWIGAGPARPEVLERMVESLRHRGPDAQGTLMRGDVGLGHARLSIIDLSTAAHQPMANEDGRVHLVYNGEFYNFLDFRARLEASGHVFRSHSDSEVLLHLYEEEGVGALTKIRGIFALALWDGRSGEMLLARDPVGVKPLYYALVRGGLVFASELKALLLHPAVTREVDELVLSAYFALGYVPGEKSILKGIRKLLPGTVLRFRPGDVRLESYWHLPRPERSGFQSEDEAAEALRAELDEAVRLQLVSDVPLGVFLSGGLDSSTIAAFAARHSKSPLCTFSIGFDDKRYDERAHARRVAEHIGANHRELTVRLDDASVVDDLAYYYDEPFADSSAIPTYHVSKLAREHVTVVLSGDGGDELFGGYNWYEWGLRLAKLRRLPAPLRSALSAAANKAPRKFPGRHLLQVLPLDEFDVYLERRSFFNAADTRALLGRDCGNPLSEFRTRYLTAGEGVLDRMSRSDFAYYLPDDILTKVDRASMAVALETRVPLLDPHICEFAFSLPESWRIRRGNRKFLLKRAAAPLLPAGFDFARKQGFSIPLVEWLRGPLGERYLEALRRPAAAELLRTERARSLLSELRAGHKERAKQVWSVLMFLLWSERYLT